MDSCIFIRNAYPSLSFFIFFNMDLTKLNIQETHKGLVDKDFTSVELTKAFLDRIDKENNKINAYLSVTSDLALSQAEEVDKKILNKPNRPENHPEYRNFSDQSLKPIEM